MRRATRWTISFAPQAARDADEIHRWWKHERRLAPLLFRNELARALARLSITPYAGAPADEGPVRRLLLPKSQHFAYYRVDATSRQVVLLRLWHTSRGAVRLLEEP